MRIDKNVEVEIIDFDFKGNGVAKYEGKAIFLNGGVIGDTVLVKLTNEKKGYYKGHILKTVRKSKLRIKSKCKHSYKCGGCDFLEYEYNRQLDWKEDKVRNDLKRIGGVEVEVEDIERMKDPQNYRNNIQLQVSENELGFFEKNSNKIINIGNCKMAKESINNIIPVLREWKGLKSVKTISIRANYKDEVMIVLITEDKVLNFNTLLPKLMDLNVVSVFENVNKDSKYRFSNKFKKLYGEDFIMDKIGELDFKLSPKSFFQVNPYQVEKLYSIAIDSLDIREKDVVLDLYCGIGTLSLMAAKTAKEVIGVEIVADAVDDARTNAEINKINNARFIAGRAENIIERLIEEEKLRVNKVILDPPRGGLDEEVIKKLLEIKPRSIAYISCNPSTQARDIALLKDKYEIKLVKPVDMFSNTVHVETVVLMSRKDK